LKTGSKDVHSGLVGGAARNPIGELVQIVNSCYNARTGEITIPGIYDDAIAATPEQLQSFLDSGFDISRFMQAHELLSLRSSDPLTVMQAIMSRPTFEVHGITGGYSGPGVKTIVPYQAEAKISLRLVPAMSPQRTFERIREFVQQLNPAVQVNYVSGASPYQGQFTGFYADAAREAMRYAFGTTPAFTREGGTIGACISMQNYLQAPLIFLGLSLPEHGYHAKNENYDWQQASGGVKMFVRYFDLISTVAK
jgi:acetylornithine deacetylase/succinyl-diaminopimelate desuccinylase-like protein